MTKKAIILLSGGLDSATTASYAIDQGYELIALSFSYGQKHNIELEKSKEIAKFLKIKQQHIIEINPLIFKNSSLTDNIDIPKNRDISKEEEIPSTYVPARNILFLSYGAALAESYNINNIFIGANAVDYSGYPDCRPKFIESFNNMINIGTKIGLEKGISIQTPLIDLTKKEIIQMGLDLNFDYSLTISCYDPQKDFTSCGECDSCQIRKAAFNELNIIDPIKYKNG